MKFPSVPLYIFIALSNKKLLASHPMFGVGKSSLTSGRMGLFGNDHRSDSLTKKSEIIKLINNYQSSPMNEHYRHIKKTDEMHY